MIHWQWNWASVSAVVGVLASLVVWTRASLYRSSIASYALYCYGRAHGGTVHRGAVIALNQVLPRARYFALPLSAAIVLWVGAVLVSSGGALGRYRSFDIPMVLVACVFLVLGTLRAAHLRRSHTRESVTREFSILSAMLVPHRR